MAQAGLSHQQNRDLPGPLGGGGGVGWGGDTSRAGVRRQVNHDLRLPPADLGTRFLSPGPGLNLPLRINLMMYSGWDTRPGMEARYLSVRRQMGHKWYLLSHLCSTALFEIRASQQKKKKKRRKWHKFQRETPSSLVFRESSAQNWQLESAA